MKYFVVIFILAASLALSFADPEEDAAFESFKKDFAKNYGSPKEEGMRKALFARTHREIKRMNAEDHTWKVAHNHMSDWTAEEKQTIRGFKKGPIVVDRSLEAPVALDRALPTSIDHRNSTCLQKIKDQGICGSCYAFSMISALEFAQCKKSGSPVVLSEQHVVDCATEAYGCYGCDGGDYTWAGKYLMSITGSVTNASYPYASGKTGLAGATCKTGTVATKPVRSAYMNVDAKGNLYPNATNIMVNLQNGPVPAAINASAPSFNSYKSGIFADPACNVGDIDHAITIVGYGTEATTNTPFWIVRNSWSTAWGISGYFLLKRGVNQCFIETYAAVLTV